MTLGLVSQNLCSLKALSHQCSKMENFSKISESESKFMETEHMEINFSEQICAEFLFGSQNLQKNQHCFSLH